MFVPQKAIDAMLRVLNGQGAEKHGDAWKTMNLDDIVAPAWGHIRKAAAHSRDFSNRDDDTNELHLTHAMARLALMIERIEGP